MHRTQGNLWILIARLTQIVLGLAVFGFSIGLAASSYYSDQLQFTSIFLGGAIPLFGTFSLFGLKHLPDDAREVQTLNLLILFIDLWAMMFSVAAGICLAVDVAGLDAVEPATKIVPAVLAFGCVFSILPAVIRTLRLWWKRMLYTVPPRHAVNDKQFVDEYATMHSPCCLQHHGPTYAPTYAPSYAPSQALSQQAPVQPPSQAGEEIKSIRSSRPQSVLSDQTLTHYPNIMSATNTSPPTRAPSQATALPPYSGRVEVGSKVEQQ